MKKSAKPMIAFGLLISVMFTLLFLGYVGIKLNSEKLTKEKVLAEEKFHAKKNWETNLLAQYQFLNSEERIVEIAANELGMIKKNSPDLILTVDQEKIEEISNKIKEKYD